MEITVARIQPIEAPRIAFVDARVAISAVALVVLLVGAPLIYSTNAGVRAFQRETVIGHVLVEKHFSRIREQQRAILAEADGLKSPEARSVFLGEELKRAKIEQKGFDQHLKGSRSAVRRLDSVFRRMTGNKELEIANQLRSMDEMLCDLADQNVTGLTQALRACPLPG